MSERECDTSTDSSYTTEDSPTSSDSDSESSQEEEDMIVIDDRFKHKLRMLILCVELNKLRNQKNT